MPSKKSKPSLPVLPQIEIDTPCPKDWDEMHGTDAKRFCDHCHLHVHNFSEMQPTEIKSLVDSGDRICARMARRDDGSIVTKACQTGSKPLTRRGWLGQLSAVAAAALGMFVTGCGKIRHANPDIHGGTTTTGEAIPQNGTANSNASNSVPKQGEVLMGDVALPEPSDSIMGGARARPSDLPAQPMTGGIGGPTTYEAKLGKVAQPLNRKPDPEKK